ncbi:hypothetical protein [Streptomyces hypolithicus]
MPGRPVPVSTSRHVAGSFNISTQRSTCPVTPERRPAGIGRYGTAIRTPDPP